MLRLESRHRAPPQAVRAAISAVLLLWTLPARGVTALAVWRQRADGRHRLRSLSDEALKDVGLSRADIEQECAKPFWRP